MGQPKAKWQFDPGAGWSADCGPFHLHANNAGDGRAELYDSEWKGLWEHQLAEPYDVVDLMLLAEAELERRLRGAAETMDGKELAAAPEPPETMQCRFCSTVVGTTETFEDVCASCLRESHAMRNAAIASTHAPAANQVDPYEAVLDQVLDDAKAPNDTHRLLAAIFKCVKTPTIDPAPAPLVHPCAVCAGVGSLNYAETGTNNYATCWCCQGNGKLDWNLKSPRWAANRVGTREWAIAEMRAGKAVVDIAGHGWIVEGNVYVRDGWAQTSEMLPATGWRLP